MGDKLKVRAVGNEVQRAYYVQDKGVTFVQSAYSDPDAPATVVMVIHATGGQIVVDRDVTVRCGGNISPTWVRRLFGEGE